jgi:hypothetical protein
MLILKKNLQISFNYLFILNYILDIKNILESSRSNANS